MARPMSRTQWSFSPSAFSTPSPDAQRIDGRDDLHVGLRRDGGDDLAPHPSRSTGDDHLSMRPYPFRGSVEQV